jgi:hypothetical protein
MYSILQSQHLPTLLLLPGELRNKIYGYAVGGIHVFIHENLQTSPIMSRVVVYQDGANRGPGTIAEYLGFTQSCRQTQAEIGLLPFTMSTVHITRISKAYSLVSLLPDARRKAITTVVVTERDAANLARRLLAFRIKLSTRLKLYNLSLIKKQLSYLSRMLSAMALPGLERVGLVREARERVHSCRSPPLYG